LNSPKRLLHRQQIESQFDRAASTYDSAAGLQRRMGNTLLQRIDALQIAKDSRLIDLGCGTGEMLAQLQHSGFSELTGLDLSAGMISVAQQKALSASFLHAAIESIPCEDQLFDLVVSNAAIQWCDASRAAAEINRILRPGGTVLLTSFVEGTLGQWRDAFLAIGQEPRIHPLASSEETRSAFTNAGFDQIEIHQCDDTSTFDSIESMFASVRRLGATNAMSSRKQPMTRSEYNDLKRYFQDRLDREGKLELDYVWVEVAARKMAQQ